MIINNNENGKYVVEDKAIQDIAQTVCLKYDDIKPSKKEDNFCIVKNDKDNVLHIIVQIRINYKVNIEKLCHKIQSDINDALTIMLGIECKNIDIDIQGFIGN